MTTKELSVNDKKTNEMMMLLNTNMSTFINCFGNEERAKRFLSGARICIQRNPSLLSCSQESLRSAIMQCSAFGLIPGAGDCCLIPYGNNVQFQLEYKGIKTLCYRSGVQYVDMDIVYEEDEFDYARGLDPFLKHIPSGKTKNPIKTYAVAKFNNEKLFNVMEKEQVMEIRNMSPSMKKAKTEEAKNKVESAWNNDPMFWMWKKTVFKQLAKILPTSEQLKQAVQLDNICERGGFIDADGSVVEEPFQQKSTVEEIPPLPIAEKFTAKKTVINSSYGEQITKCKSLDELANIQIAIKEDEEMTDDESEILHQMADEKQKILN